MKVVMSVWLKPKNLVTGTGLKMRPFKSPFYIKTRKASILEAKYMEVRGDSRPLHGTV